MSLAIQMSSTAKKPCTSHPLAEDRPVFTDVDKVVEASDTVYNSGLDYDIIVKYDVSCDVEKGRIACFLSHGC